MSKDVLGYPRKVKEGVFLVWKEVGETPLQALERLRKQEGIEPDVKMTYAGRLDPLAEGELLILTGGECKKKDEYLGLDKVYEVEILLGAQTDTDDVMGKMVEGGELKDGDVVSDDIDISIYDPLIKSHMGFDERIDYGHVRKILQKFTGNVTWPYPIFSSKTVQGKPLFLWALEGKAGEVEIPARESKIYELELLSTSTTKLSELRELVHSKINSIAKVSENIVNGKDTKRLGQDFRRAEVLKSWAEFFEKCSRGPLEHLEVVKVRCKCSSGTYMRTLARKVGEELGIPALALSIVRTEIVV